jgi:hypothetical protein
MDLGTVYVILWLLPTRRNTVNYLFLLLFASTLSAQPVQHITDLKNDGISYVCYMENDVLMLAKVQQDASVLETRIIDTGIFTNSIEKVTMELQNGEICVNVTYTDSPALQAFFDRTSLELSQIMLSEPMQLADSGIEQE